MKKSLQNALEHILRPIGLLLIKEGCTYGMFSELLKTSLVQSAEKALQNDRATVTDSRLSLITGIHRKDIKRLKEAEPTSFNENEISIPAQVIAKWMASPEYTNHGKPKVLPRKNVNEVNDFESLVKTISKDIRPRAVLDELIDRKIVNTLPDGQIELNVEKITASPSKESIIKFIGMNIHDHLQTSINNYLNDDTKQLDRCAYYHGLSKNAAEELSKLAEELTMESLIKINQKAQELIREEKNHGSYRTNFGMYFYKENNTAEKNA